MTAIPITRLCATHKGPHAPAASHGHICTTCHHRLAHTLRDLPRLWLAVLELATSHLAGGGRRGPNSAAPLRLDVLAVLDPRSQADDTLTPAAGIITDWAQLITAERSWRLPATIGAHIDVITRSLPWLEDRGDLITDANRELQSVHHALRHLAGETATVIATCQQPHPDPQVDGECGGALIHTADSDWPVRCTECGDAWSAAGITLAYDQWRNDQQRTHA